MVRVHVPGGHSSDCWPRCQHRREALRALRTEVLLQQERPDDIVAWRQQ